MMDIGTMAQWGSLAVAALALIYTVSSARSKVSSEAWRDVNTKLSGHDAKLTRHDAEIEQIRRDIEHLPDKESMHEVELMIRDLKTDFAVLNERLKPVAAISDRLQEFLLEQAKDKK